MSNKKKLVFTEKHLESIADKNVTLIFSIFGNFQGRVVGKIVGRKRNRFKQFVFVPTFPFMTFIFSVSDVENIEFSNSNGVVISLDPNYEPPKKKRKKKLPAVNPEIDLNKSEADDCIVNAI